MQQMEMEIAMLGQSRVGKTSLLTVMYDRFDAEIDQTDLQLIPDRATRNRLADRLADLKSLTQNEDVLLPGPGLPGEGKHMMYTFCMARRGIAKEKADLKLIFHDYPGGFLTGTDHQQSFVEGLTERCGAILIPIDTPALMAEKGRWNTLTNNPARVAGILKGHLNEDTVSKAGRTRLLVLAPVKCEKFLDKKEDRTCLLDTVRREYAILLRHLASEPLRPHIAVVIAPVQTVGSVIFHRIEVKDDQPIFHFRRRSFDAVYDPHDSEQILRYLLRFVLSQYLKNRWFSMIRDWIGWDKHFQNAVQAFTSGCRDDLPFCVVQGRELLSPT